MGATTRHLAVFLIGFAAAFFIADRLGEQQDATTIYLYFFALFVLYLGISYWLAGRRAR